MQAGRQCMHQRRRCSPCMLMPALLGLRAQQHARQECAAGRAARGRPRGAPLARCSSTVSPPPESAKRLILFLICAAVSVTKMALLGSLPLILPVSPCTGARASRARACTRSAAGAQFVPARRSLRSRSLQACRTLHRLKQAHAWAEDRPEIFIGCAGGGDSKLALPVAFSPVPAGAAAFQVTVSGGGRRQAGPCLRRIHRIAQSTYPQDRTELLDSVRSGADGVVGLHPCMRP